MSSCDSVAIVRGERGTEGEAAQFDFSLVF